MRTPWDVPQTHGELFERCPHKDEATGANHHKFDKDGFCIFCGNKQQGGDAICTPTQTDTQKVAPVLTVEPSSEILANSNSAPTVPPAGAEHYPNKPGFKRAGTSQDAATEVSTEASVLRQACLDCITESPKTSDEVAEALGRSVLAIRPRISELVATGKVTETTARHRNVSGKWASVWRAV